MLTDRSELDFLLRFPIVLNVVSPVDFLNNVSWGGVKALANMEQFRNFDKDIEERLIARTQDSYQNMFLGALQGSAKHWKKFTDSDSPEEEKFPGEWKNKDLLQKLCMMRALRPDRMTYAVS